MGQIIELRMCEEDRKKLGGPEWIPLDVDRVLDTPGGTLRRWELETNYPIERAMTQAGGSMPAVATQVLVWLARKQTGDASDPDNDGKPEAFARLDQIRTMRVALRRAPGTAEAEADAVPPGQPVYVSGMPTEDDPPESTPQP